MNINTLLRVRWRYPVWIISLFILMHSLWLTGSQHQRFTCRAQLRVESSCSQCEKVNVFDLFIAINENGRGYLLISGSRVDSEEVRSNFNRVIDFTYSKQGEGYNLRLNKQEVTSNKVLSDLKIDGDKMNLKMIDYHRYLLSWRKDNLLVCTMD